MQPGLDAASNLSLYLVFTFADYNSKDRVWQCLLWAFAKLKLNAACVQATEGFLVDH